MNTTSIKIQSNVPFILQPFAGDSRQPRIRRIQRLVHHVFDRIVEALIFESHAVRQRSKHIHIRPAFAQWLNCRV